MIAQIDANYSILIYQRTRQHSQITQGAEHTMDKDNN